MNPTIIAGRYELQGRLGVGGMSTVHLALDRRLERHVAVKLLAEHLADDPAFVSRFRREALSVARLVHPNIVQVFDFGIDEAAGQNFIVMERVDGPSCAQLLRDEGHLGVDDAVAVLVQACRGLDYAHRGGVIHRDVKPGNLLRSRDGVVKLADFGIAKAAEQSSITQVGSVLGTAAYLAPEQARGDAAGPASDLYSLGVVAYQLLSGRLPYEASSLSELVVKQQREVPPPLDQLNPEVPSTLARAVSYALAGDPRARPADAAALETALLAGAAGREPAGPEDATLPIGESTAATRVLGGSPPTGATRALPRSEQGAAGRRLGPRPAPAAPAYDPLPPARRIDRPRAAPRRPRPLRWLRRLVALIVILCIVGGAAAVALIATGASDKALRITSVVGNDVQQAIGSMRQLIDDNTK